MLIFYALVTTFKSVYRSAYTFLFAVFCFSLISCAQQGERLSEKNDSEPPSLLVSTQYNACPINLLSETNADTSSALLKQLNPAVEATTESSCEPKVITRITMNSNLCKLGSVSMHGTTLGIIKNSNRPIFNVYVSKYTQEKHQRIELTLDKHFKKLDQEQYPNAFKIENKDHPLSSVYVFNDIYISVQKPNINSQEDENTTVSFIHKDYMNLSLAKQDICI